MRDFPRPVGMGNLENVLRGIEKTYTLAFLLRKQYVGNMAPDSLAISTHPVKKVIYAFAVHQPLLLGNARCSSIVFGPPCPDLQFQVN